MISQAQMDSLAGYPTPTDTRSLANGLPVATLELKTYFKQLARPDVEQCKGRDQAQDILPVFQAWHTRA